MKTKRSDAQKGAKNNSKGIINKSNIIYKENISVSDVIQGFMSMGG